MATELPRERLRVGLEKRQNRQICFHIFGCHLFIHFVFFSWHSLLQQPKMVDTELMGRDPLMGMIVEEVGADNVGPDINTVSVFFQCFFLSRFQLFQVVEGSESLDMFMDMSNPYNKTVHAALQTVAEDMKNRLLEKGIKAFSSRNF